MVQQAVDECLAAQGDVLSLLARLPLQPLTSLHVAAQRCKLSLIALQHEVLLSNLIASLLCLSVTDCVKRMTGKQLQLPESNL